MVRFAGGGLRRALSDRFYSRRNYIAYGAAFLMEVWIDSFLSETNVFCLWQEITRSGKLVLGMLRIL